MTSIEMIDYQRPRPLAEQIIYHDRLRKWCERMKKARVREGKSYDFFEPAIPHLLRRTK